MTTVVSSSDSLERTARRSGRPADQAVWSTQRRPAVPRPDATEARELLDAKD